MIITLYAIAAVLMAIASLYFAWRSIDVRKFPADRLRRSVESYG